VKTIPGARWDPKAKCWHIALIYGPAEKLNHRFRGKLLFESKESGELSVVPEAASQKNLQPAKSDSFQSARERAVLPPEYIKTMIKKVSPSHENQSINAIKFYYEKILGRPVERYYIQRPRREKKLPLVLSEEEVTLIFRQIKNIKHKCIMYLIYSGGLRLSEVINLKIADIDSKRKEILIHNGKGKKDRNTLLSEKVVYFLREYYKLHRPKV